MVVFAQSDGLGIQVGGAIKPLLLYHALLAGVLIAVLYKFSIE